LLPSTIGIALSGESLSLLFTHISFWQGFSPRSNHQLGAGGHMKARLLVLAIVLGMSAPMFASGVQVDFTMGGPYRVTVTEGDSVEIFESFDPWVLSICYDPDTPDSNTSTTRGAYIGAIQHWTVSNPFGFLTPTFIPDVLNRIDVSNDEPFPPPPPEGPGDVDIWGAFADGVGDGNFQGFFSIFFRGLGNQLASDALVPPWDITSLTFIAVNDGGLHGGWSGYIGDAFVEAEWSSLNPDVKVTIKGVPEPGTLSLLAAGLLAGAAFRKRLQ